MDFFFKYVKIKLFIIIIIFNCFQNQSHIFIWRENRKQPYFIKP